MRWIHGDAGRLPFNDGTFDVVTSTEAFHWFPDQDAVLREAYRVLTPEGAEVTWSPWSLSARRRGNL